MNKPKIPLNVPLLGAKKWKCQKGHEWKGEQPPRWQFALAAGQGVQSGPLCLICLLEWAAFTFAVVEDKEAFD